MSDTAINILSLLPQQPPFVMVDELFYSDPLCTRTRFVITEENPLTINGQFTEAGLLENIAQTAAAGAGHRAQQEGTPVRDGYIGAVKNLEVFALPVTGDQITTEIFLGEQVFDMTVINGKVWRNNELLAQCELKIFLAVTPG